MEWIEFEGMVGVVDLYFGVPCLYLARNGNVAAAFGSMEGDRHRELLHPDAGEGC